MVSFKPEDVLRGLNKEFRKLVMEYGWGAHQVQVLVQVYLG